MKVIKYLSVALVAVAFAACSSKTEKAEENTAETTEQEQAAPGQPGAVANMPNLKGDRLTVVDFNATWCGPCKMIQPIFQAMEQKYGDKVDFISVDIDEQPDLATEFDVQAIPTIILINPDGIIAERYVGTEGIDSEDLFSAIIEKNLPAPAPAAQGK